MRTTSSSGLAGCATVLCLLSGLAPAAAATPVAAGITVHLPDRGKVLADGAGVSVTVTFQCEAGQSYNMFVELSQAVLDGRTASGVGFAGPGTCTGAAQTEDLLLMATGGFYAFRSGDSVARATLSVCPNEQQCSQAMDSGVLELQESFG
ncbi:hypothetical protein LVY72_01165 [Arthrobacter sp. I2-34]|uniref:Uncharacterized protein n=1 Tax=Arthrobacter hankyongi TaxID=2904801 RepID=A0ABS9L1E9_9MICC|nr:hypothetical protein [Arthrobacter hankyongi]MCG2620517.1 hypothetical protein [Arthrobacter hankyongi]